MYDENGSPFAMSVKDASSGTVKTYYYEKNLQGDIVGIMNEAGYKVVSYTYDAWGNPYTPTYVYHSGVSATDRDNVELNPFRYRGYYYDSETGYYYLQTRYYNPDLGRFLNADGYVNANGDILGYNMFAYCSNNPVNKIDPTGEGWFSDLIDTLKSMYEQMRNKDGSHSLYDNDRFEDVNPFHEQIAVVSVSEPSFDVREGSFGLGSYGADLYTGGWEWEHFDLSLLDFGHAEVAAEYKDDSFAFGASACIWNPSMTFSFDHLAIQVGAEVGSVGAGISKSSDGFSAKAGGAVGFSVKVRWK